MAHVAVLPHHVSVSFRRRGAPPCDPCIVSLIDQLLPVEPVLRIAVAGVKTGFRAKQLLHRIHARADRLRAGLICGVFVEPLHILIVNEERQIQHHTGIFQSIPLAGICNELDFLPGFCSVECLAEPVRTHHDSGCLCAHHVLDKHGIHNVIVRAVAPVHCPDHSKLDTIRLDFIPVNNALSRRNVNPLHFLQGSRLREILAVHPLTDRHMTVRIEVVHFAVNGMPSGDRLTVHVQMIHQISDLAPARHKEPVFIKIPVEPVHVVPARHGAAVRPQIARHAVRHPLVLHKSG